MPTIMHQRPQPPKETTEGGGRKTEREQEEKRNPVVRLELFANILCFLNSLRKLPNKLNQKMISSYAEKI